MTVTMLDQTGRDYLSFSSLSTYADCGERFYWERVRSVRTDQGWWLPAGSAFHTASEWLDRGTTLTPELAWSDAFRMELNRLDELPTKAGGRASKEFPNKEDADFWNAKAPQWLADYVNWRNQMFDAGWSWLQVRGEDAIEVPVTATLFDVEVKGFIDRIMVSPDGEVHVVDIKTGSREPASLQLNVYQHLLEVVHDVHASHGAYYMARKGTTTEPKSLSISMETIARYFASAKKGIESEIYLPNVGMLCGTCGVRKHCSVFSE